MGPLWIGIGALAMAQDAISFEAVTRVQLGEQDPSVTFHSRVAGSLKVDVRCGDRTFSMQKPLQPGSSHTLALKGLPAGQHACSGQVRLDEQDGAWAEMPLKFDVALMGTLDWTFGLEDVDLRQKTLVVHPSRPLSDASLELIGIGGRVLASETAVLSDPVNPTFSWTTDDEVLKLVVTGTDAAGIRGKLELSPWSYAIPHEDVVFPSGSHAIGAGEAPKLERCWDEVVAVLDKYGSVVDIELFVAGYTDTVGDAAMNQGLSERRARAIAQWFRSRGFRGPVWYQGFGEEALAVATPDETDERANRRALYVLAAEKPISPAFPRADWQRL